MAAAEGKAVLVTFIYTHCPDPCPVIVGPQSVADFRRELRRAS